MPVYVSLLRAVNLAGRSTVRMAALADLYRTEGFEDVTTVLQSGNVIFSSKARSAPRIAARLEAALAREFGLRTTVILRTAAEIADVIARNPFAGRDDVNPSRLLVLFLAGEPTASAEGDLAERYKGPEEIVISGRECYIHYIDGIGRSKLTAALLDRTLGAAGTARNWNTLQRIAKVLAR
jgi:uncharacterized protein (DUF1697 family)